MSKSGENDAKRTSENHFTSDSGFHSGFQDSREILSSPDIALGNPADKKEFDSGIVSNETAAIQITPFIPDFLKEAFKRTTSHPAVDKYFEQDETDGFTWLHLAILNSNWQAINTLITLASDASFLNIKNFHGQTALHLACFLNQKHACR